MTPREHFSLAQSGALLYIFGGAQFTNEAFNDLFVLDTKEPCPSNCSARGICRNDRCNCQRGFYGKALLL